MSAKTGRKAPTVPDLKEAQCIFLVGLRKEWSDKCSYWIELYRRDFKPTKNGTKRPPLFYVYRQWSFYKKIDEKVVEGGYSSEPSISIPSAMNTLVDYVRMREEKGDIVHFVEEHDDHPGLINMMDVEQKERAALRTKISDRSDRPETTAEKFKKTQLERQKRAKW
jgi:hypothetical protein